MPQQVFRANNCPRKNASCFSLDVLLATNKQAVSRSTKMLDCASCSASSTSFLLISALLNQTLTLYHSACEVYLSRPPTSSGSSSSNNSGGSAAAASPPIVPGPLRLNFGAYRIEEEDEILLKQELMLIELRKVEGLLGRFRDLIAQVEDQAEGNTYETILGQLTRHLQQTVRVLQPRR